MGETSNKPLPKSKQALAPLLAGFSAGTISTGLLLPLDNIKVRLQVHEGEVYSSKKSTKNGRLGSLRIIRGVIKHEGFAGFYQGLTPALIGSAVSWGGFFFVYEGLKTELRKRKTKAGTPTGQDLSSLDNFVLACASGGIMVGLTNPIWLIKLRMQLQMKKASQSVQPSVRPYESMVDAARTIVRDEGFWALYKGSGPALLLTSHGGVQFVVYEFLRKHFHYARASRDTKEQTRSSVLDRLEKSTGYLTIGAIAKMIASTVTYPIQVVKSRMQQRSEFVELTAEGEVRVVKREYSKMLGSVVRIWQKEGLSGYFKGCIPNAIRVAPSAAVTFVVYETIMDIIAS